MKNHDKWWDTNIHWICGGIDSYGNVIGHPCYHDDSDLSHTPAEKAITSFRWNVADQMFMEHMIPQKRDMTEDEFFKVQDWLIKNGYADDESF